MPLYEIYCNACDTYDEQLLGIGKPPDYCSCGSSPRIFTSLSINNISCEKYLSTKNTRFERFKLLKLVPNIIELSKKDRLFYQPNVLNMLNGAKHLQEISPKGSFSKYAMNKLVTSLNTILPILSSKEQVRTFIADINQFSIDLTHLLLSIRSTIGNYINETSENKNHEQLSREAYLFDLEYIKNDFDILALSLCLEELSKNEEFKIWLKIPYSEISEKQFLRGLFKQYGPKTYKSPTLEEEIKKQLNPPTRKKQSIWDYCDPRLIWEWHTIKIWDLLHNKDQILSALTSFQLLITPLPNVKGYIDLVFETSTDIKTPEELLQYLNSIDVYLMKRFPQTYKPYLCEDPDWNLLSLLINKLKRDGLEPFVITIKLDAIYTSYNLCPTPYVEYSSHIEDKIF